MNASHLLEALETLADINDVPAEDLATALAETLHNEVTRFADTDNAYVALDMESGELTLQALPLDEDPYNVTLEDLGRRGASAIKESFDRVILQARVERLEELLKSSTGTLVHGVIHQAAKDTAIIDLPDGVEGELRAVNAPGLSFRKNQDVTAIITGEVDLSGSQPRARLSRRVPGFIEQLLEEAVPSVADGTIELLAVAREPGVRTKILVKSNSESSDPVALIIGTKGSTIKKVTEQTFPERIDVISFGAIEETVAAALAPGKVDSIQIEDDKIIAWVLADQRSAIFGRGGTNVRLASILVGARIEIRSPEDETAVDTKN